MSAFILFLRQTNLAAIHAVAKRLAPIFPRCNHAGASGNPAPVELPDGVTVRYSTWVETAPDGTPVEGRGIEPDVRVDPKGDGDPTLEAAIGELRKKIK